MDTKTVIDGLRWILADETGFWFGSNWDNGEPRSDEERAGKLIWEAIELLTSNQCTIDQFRWERDTAVDQLNEIGKGLGERMDDIVELLKKKEAVLLTLDDVKKTERDTVLWTELRPCKPYPPVYPVCFQRISKEPMSAGDETIESIEYTDGYDDVQDYGYFYRLWTNKPTDEQRRNTPWKESKIIRDL